MASLFLLAILAAPDVQVTNRSINEFVDIIELHQCHDFRGNFAFKQLIFYRWSKYHRRFQIVDTVVVNSDSMIPRKNRNGFYCCRWKVEDGQRIIMSQTFRETKSQSDPEVKEREYLPIHLRQGLKKIKPDPPQNEIGVRTSSIPPRPERMVKF